MSASEKKKDSVFTKSKTAPPDYSEDADGAVAEGTYL